MSVSMDLPSGDATIQGAKLTSDTTQLLGTKSSRLWWVPIIAPLALVISSIACGVIAFAFILKSQRVLPSLPVLTPSTENRLSHREWHAYFESVYGEPVQQPVDLNTFEWFYNFAPLHLYSYVAVSISSATDHLDQGALFYDDNPATITSAYAQFGLFVYRGGASLKWQHGGPVEVLHMACPHEDNGDTMWFYPLMGTGVFVNASAAIAVRHTPEFSISEFFIQSEQPRRDACAGDIAYWTGGNATVPCRCTSDRGITSCGHALKAVARMRPTC